MIKTKHFNPSEFVCPCCGKEKMNQNFINRLEMARSADVVLFKITSGFRCREKQEALRREGYHTADGLSPHEEGRACDIACTNETRWAILSNLIKQGFNRFGIGQNFIHVDDSEFRKPKRIWVYK